MSNPIPTGTSISSSKRPGPLSLRLSTAERAVLVARAGGLPLSTYAKSVLLAPDAPIVRAAPRLATVDQQLMAQLLAMLGASRMAANLSQLAKHANLGTLLFDEGAKDDIRQASEDLRAMRVLLMRALGKKIPEADLKAALSPLFARDAQSSGGER